MTVHELFIFLIQTNRFDNVSPNPTVSVLVSVSLLCCVALFWVICQQQIVVDYVIKSKNCAYISWI